MELGELRQYRFYFAYLVFFGVLLWGIGPSLWLHIRMLFSQGGVGYVIKQRWDFALGYIAMFSLFFLFLSKHPLKEVKWKQYSLYTAFIVALFVEMFGFPLTIYLLSPVLPGASGSLPPIMFEAVLLGQVFRLEFNTAVGLVVSVFSAVLIILGWKQVYTGEGLVTYGLYSVVRHPQYTGMLLMISVWALVWPTLFTIALWPVLVYSYYGLCRSEEKEMVRQFGKHYVEYKEQVPMLLPFLKMGL